MIDDIGPERVISDVYPELLPTLRTLAGTGDDRARGTISKILEWRNELNFNHRDSILNAVRGNTMRSQAAFDAYLKRQQRALVPQYDDLFSRMDAAQWAREVPTMRDSITRAFNKTLPKHGDDLSAVMDVLNRHSGSRPRMTFREINEARKEIQDLIYQRIRSNASAANDQVTPIGNLRTASHYLRGLLETNSEFSRLQRVYGDIQDARNAYEFAMNTVKRPNLLGEDANLMFGGSPSQLVAEALAEGGRFGLYTQMRGAANPMTAMRDARLEDLAAFIGKGAVDDIAEQATRYTNMEATRATVAAGTSAKPQGLNEAFRGQTIMDLFTAGQALSGEARGVGPAFAGRRLIQRSFGSNPTPYPGELQRSARLGAEAMTNNRAAAGAVRAASNQGGPTINQALGMALGVDATDTLANSEFVNETIPETGAQLNDWFTNLLIERAIR